MTDSQRFAELCRDEAESLSRLVALLDEEFAVLEKGEMRRVEAIAAEKAAALETIEERGRARAQWMLDKGIHSVEGVAAWLPDKPEADAAWRALEDALEEAKARNARNGAIIERGLERTGEALVFLRSCAASTLGYGKDGTTPDIPVGGRHLGSA
ncbi:flagella synthesis protein FlgN [Paludibacterium paludis]|uniref:Flagella synthesis protein FlgN n=1 Tax=Paludibacterium paludis TaxID=1225769 RepID=A0A918NWB7_9NEIS|nr:flagellar protein FlgN [Paludibacterium paludis]GGY02187.1 hypothetical protein GCM10011289_00310 [Paludibacterium paludis]